MLRTIFELDKKLSHRIVESIKHIIKELYGIDYEVKLIKQTKPVKDNRFGDIVFPCFDLASFLIKNKITKDNAITIAQTIGERLSDIKLEGIDKIVAIQGYLNIYYDDIYLSKIIRYAYKAKDKYAYQNLGNSKRVIIDFSSPNIAKPFGIAHLRSTIIGASLSRILAYLNYKVIKVNHLGDWGTQFGKLIVAYKLWGNEKELEKGGVHYLLNLYIRFHKEVSQDEKRAKDLEDKAREWFRRLEQHDKEALSLWELFREISIEEFKKYYKTLNIEFDYYLGESFYAAPRLCEKYLKIIRKKIRVEKDQGAEIIRLDNMPPFFIKKSDGTTTYHTRDLIAAIYRVEKLKADKVLYVISRQQEMHMKQLFAVLSRLGYDTRKFEHIAFGNMTFEGKMMRTRLGNFILLEEVVEKAKQLALEIIEKKNPKLRNKHSVAEKVGISAIIFNDLCQDREKDIDFKWEKALNFEGETGPYLQYTHARLWSLLNKAKNDHGIKIKIKDFDLNLINDKEKEIIREIIKLIQLYPYAVSEAALKRKPHIIAKSILSIAKKFNEYYDKYRIISDDYKVTNTKLVICCILKNIISHGLRLLMIEPVNQM